MGSTFGGWEGRVEDAGVISKSRSGEMGKGVLRAGTFAVIPAFNAGAALLEVARRTAELLGRDYVVVVNDGSADASSEDLRRAGFTVVDHDTNRGKGAALRTGFAEALRRGAVGVVTLDADGQHDPGWISGLLGAAGGTDVVVGSRMKDPGPMPWLRVAVNRFTSAVVSALAGVRLTDSQSGFRWISARVLERVPLESDRFDAESEILIKAAVLGFRIREFPIPALYGKERSKVHPVRDTLRFFRLVGRSFRWRREMKRRRQRTSA